MTPTKPYFIRALYDWIADNGCTPHLLVDVSDKRCAVPMQYARDGMIVLNIAPGAVRDLQMGNDFVMFSARFGGVAQDITVPVDAVRALYAKENGRGLAFDEETSPAVTDSEDSPDSPPPSGPKARTPPRLTVVK